MTDLRVAAIGGGFGAGLRYLVDTLLRERLGVAPGWSTLIINLLGSFVFGLALAFAFAGGTSGDPDPVAAAVMSITGGFTTFSTASLDAFQALRRRSWWLALALTFGQMAACIGAVLVGHWCAAPFAP